MEIEEYFSERSDFKKMENLKFNSEVTIASKKRTYSFPTLQTTELLRQLNRFRMTGTFCDAVLATEDGATYRVHKIVMSWCSSYFSILFTMPLSDKSSGEKPCSKSYFIIPGVSSTALESIIKFAYSGIVDVNQDNVNELLPAADQFDVPGVVDGCVVYLIENLSPDNCVNVWRFGKDYFMWRLETESFRYLMKFFPHISANSDEFLKLNLSLIEDILNSNSLNAPSEFLVWTAVKRWCQYTWTDRKQFVPQLVQCVRLALLPINDFRKLMDDPWIFRNARCRTHFNVVSQFLLNELRDKSQILNDDKAVLMFTPRHPHDVIITGGGWTLSGPTNVFEVYDCRANLWKMWAYISPMNERRSDASAASLRSRVFVVGGFDGDVFLQSAECYYAELDRWFLLPPMLRRRSGVGCVALEGAVYAIGGYDGQRLLSSVEKYCVNSRQWIASKAMRLARSNFAVALLEKKIYVMGGYNDEADTITEASECFDPTKVQWFSIAPMNVSRSGLSACTLSGIRDITPYIKDDRFRCLLKADVSGESVDVCS